MSTTLKTNSVPNKLKVPYAPTRKELIALYPHYAQYVIKNSYKKVKEKYPALLKQRSLTNFQFIKFMEHYGLPKGFKKSDFPFLEGIIVL